MSMQWDWVQLRKAITVEWSGAKYTIQAGERGRALKENEDGTLNVSFGLIRGIHPIEKQDLDPA